MRFSRTRLVLLAAVPLATLAGFQGGGSVAHATASAQTIHCATAATCTEVSNPDAAFPGVEYVGHDEPSTLFYSNRPGSGNNNVYQLTLPKDPSPSSPMTPGKSYNFMLHPAFWFGMAMCDNQSFPEQVSNCTPDSDTNIVDPAVSPAHPGVAFMEMQFYPPGFAPWPAGNSCDATKWCAALNIDSLSQNGVTNQLNNPSCQAFGVEYVNFAFITLSGTPQPGSPPSPVLATAGTFTPNPAADLFMNSGDKLSVKEHDTAHGLQIVIKDKTTGQTGSMTASASNNFGQEKYDPTAGTCTNIPYDFHPMYSTSSEQTRVTWAAHSYNIAFADETGHFDYCSGVTVTGGCTGTEGTGINTEPTDEDDGGCFPAAASTLVQVSGCIGTNTGFDGVPYTPVWPDGNTALHPTPIQFSSPTTGGHQYSRMAFEADLPRIENAPCDRFTGSGCTLIPTTDDLGASGQPAPALFYPFFSITKVGHSCMWQLGNHIPGSTNDFGQNAQYGTLLQSVYTSGTTTTVRYNNFRQILSTNPCPQG